MISSLKIGFQNLEESSCNHSWEGCGSCGRIRWWGGGEGGDGGEGGGEGGEWGGGGEGGGDGGEGGEW